MIEWLKANHFAHVAARTWLHPDDYVLYHRVEGWVFATEGGAHVYPGVYPTPAAAVAAAGVDTDYYE